MIYQKIKKIFAVANFLGIVFFCPLLASDLEVSDLFSYAVEGRRPFLAGIESAKKTLKVAAYRLDDPVLEKAFLSAAQRGISVDILLEDRPFQHECTQSSVQAFAPPNNLPITFYKRPSWVHQTHYKVLLIDEKQAFLTTGNFDTESFDGNSKTRGTCDFSVLITDRDLVQEISQVFDHDCLNQRSVLRDSGLVWGPDNQRARLSFFIESARKSLWIYQQDISDENFFQALLGQARRGIDVRLIMTPFLFHATNDHNFPHQMQLKQPGGQVRFIEVGSYVHAKVIIVDGDEVSAKAYLGSCNFYEESIDFNRELGLILTGSQILQKLKTYFIEDFSRGCTDHPLEKKETEKGLSDDIS